MKLVIAEKPSVAMALASVLGARTRKDGYVEGNGYIVSWCVGHLVGLCDASEYDEKYKKWRYEDLPIVPECWKHKILEGTKKQFGILKKLMRDSEVNEVICATDAGREGELIFRLVYEQAGCKKPMKRLWISSMEEQAIKDGFVSLKDGSCYDSLYQSALCRAKADWLVGINASRLFSVLYNQNLKVGRVQTPTLAMIVDRNQKIKEFTKEKYYMAHIKFDDMDAVTEHFQKKEDADKVAAECQERMCEVEKDDVKEKTVRPPKLYDLTTLQREARINDIPCILKIHNEVNSDDPDNFFYLFYKMQVGFKSGELQLEDPAGPILWYSRFVIPPDFNYEEKNCKEFDKSNVVIISEGSKYYDIFWNKWGEAIIKQVVIAGDYIIYDKAYNSNIQKQLYQSKQWHEVMKNIGYPREKSVCSYEENTIDRIQEFIYKKNIQKCDFASIFSNLNRKKILEIKHKLDKACLYSMLFTLKSEEKVFVGDILEVKKPYISERGKKDFSYVIDRWIKALIDNHMIGQENNCAISRIELCALDVEEAWKEAKRTWIGTLSDSVVIDYYYRNAKHLEELLADNLNATYLLFTEGKMDVAEDFYTNTLIARYLNHIISDKIFHFYNPGMTILEIGAGTGASTELILKKVGVDVKYIFTDLSSYFLNAAQDKFSVFPNVEYQILDIDQDFSGQGIDQDSVDIVVASGMLNNALDTEFTISNIWKVLKKGGIIFIAEPVEELLELQISQVFMMTKPVDMRYLNNQTFFNEKQWIDILEKSNFEIVDIVPDDSDMLSVLQQKLIIGRK